MILFKNIFLLFVLIQLINPAANGQSTKKDCLNVNIEKLITPQTSHIYKSKKKGVRLFYFQNQFNDSIAFIINDTLVANDFYKTDFNSGATGKIIKFTYSKHKNVTIKLLIGSDFGSSKKEIVFTIKEVILRTYKLFFFYKLECGFNLYYSNFIPYYE